MYEISGEQLERIITPINPLYSNPTIKPLTGGYSSYVFHLTCQSPEGKKDFALRIPKSEVLKVIPNVVQTEFRLLKELTASGIRVPMAVFLDTSLQILSDPFMVVGWVEGQTVFQPEDPFIFVKRLAGILSEIHQIDRTKHDVSFLPQITDDVYRESIVREKEIDDSIREGEIRNVLKQNWPFPHRNDHVLLHGDYWPGNVMWSGDEPTVIDWVDSAVGEPLEDLGNTRMELLWVLGPEMVDTFTQEYQLQNPTLDYRDLPYWDLMASLRPAFKLGKWADGNDKREQEMRTWHRQFVDEAMEKIKTSG